MFGFRNRTPARLALVLICFPGLSLAAQAAPASAPSPSPAVRFSGYLQVRESWDEQTGLSASLNHLRVTATGNPLAGLSWKLQAELRTGSVGSGKASVALQDGFVRYQRGAFAAQAGQFKTPFSAEYLISIADLEVPNRALVVDALATKRDLGLIVEAGAGKKLTVTAGVFNGDGVNVIVNRDSTLLGVGRVVVRPLPGVELSSNVAAFGGDSLRYGGGMSVRRGRFLGRGEYLGQRRDGGINDDAGWYALAGVQVHRRVQVLGRYEVLKLGDGPTALDIQAWTVAGGMAIVERVVQLQVAGGIRRDQPTSDWTPTGIVQLQVRF